MSRFLNAQNAVVLPLTELDLFQGKSGVFVNGDCIESSLLFRHFGQIIFPGKFTKPDVELEEPALFGGYLFDHFGHFLLESLSRLWFAKERPDLSIAWCGANQYNAWQREILELLGIRNRPIFVAEPTSFQSLVVPTPGYYVQTQFDLEHAKFLAVVEPEHVQPGRRCWLSRTKIKNGTGGLQSEEKLEEYLREAGWHIYHPQDYLVIEQLKFISSCEMVAGVEGAAFHALILLKDLKTKIKILCARGRENQNYETIAAIKNFNQERIRLANAQKLPELAGFSRVVAPDFSEILKALEIPQTKAEAIYHRL
jgi:capsular polysaccharide biosynthesis protein